MKCGPRRLGQVGPTGFSKVTGSFLTGNRSVLVSLSSGSHGPGGCCAPDAPLGARQGRTALWAAGGSSGNPLFYRRGMGREAAPPPPFPRPTPSPPPLAPALPPSLPPFPARALPSIRGEKGGGAEPSPGTGGVCVPSVPLPPARLSWLPEAGVSRKSSERCRTTERTETSSSPSERPC